MKQIFPILAVLAALLVFAIKFLPWWASLTLLAIGIAGIRWGSKLFLKQVFMVPFKMKGKVLAGASVKMNGCTAAPRPSSCRYGDEELDEETNQRYQQMEWYYLDVSINPVAQSEGCGFMLWEPSELIMVSTNVKAKDLENGLDGDACEMHDCKIFVDGQFVEDEESKYEGSQRLQLHIGVLPSINKLQFQYYFELFGSIALLAPLVIGIPVATR
jgi:hypothetical protein